MILLLDFGNAINLDRVVLVSATPTGTQFLVQPPQVNPPGVLGPTAPPFAVHCAGVNFLELIEVLQAAHLCIVAPRHDAVAATAGMD